MKLTLTNTFHCKQITVYPRGEPMEFAGNKAYKISERTFNRINSVLCGSKNCTCGGTYGDKEYSLMFYYPSAYCKEYYIEVLK